MTQLLSVEKAADILGISPWTIRNYERAGKIQAVRIGRRVLFRQEDLAKFIDEHRAEQPALSGCELSHIST
jgi:excisionase family DNA binding protein